MSDKTKRLAIAAVILAVLLFGGTVFTTALIGSSTGDTDMMMDEAAEAAENMAERLAPGSYNLNTQLYYAVYILGIHGTRPMEVTAEDLILCFVREEEDGIFSIMEEDEIYSNIEARYGVTITEADREEYDALMRMAAQIGIYHGDGTSIVEVALSQVGQFGGEPYWRWYGCGSRQPWCAMFVSWCAEQCGYLDTGIIPKTAVANEEWYEDRDQFMNRWYEPNPGDLIFFDWKYDGQDGLGDHVGIVVSCDGNTVFTVEGNSGDQVACRSYEVGDPEILGYGIPRYPVYEDLPETVVDTKNQAPAA